jgi:hypothetical protein
MDCSRFHYNHHPRYKAIQREILCAVETVVKIITKQKFNEELIVSHRSLNDSGNVKAGRWLYNVTLKQASYLHE